MLNKDNANDKQVLLDEATLLNMKLRLTDWATSLAKNNEWSYPFNGTDVRISEWQILTKLQKALSRVLTGAHTAGFVISRLKLAPADYSQNEKNVSDAESTTAF